MAQPELSCISEQESKGLVGCFCAWGGCAVEPECLGQPWPEEASRRRKSASAGFCWRAGEWRGELEKGAQPKKRARKEEAWKEFCWSDAEERAGKGACPYRRLCEMWQKGLRFQDGGTRRSRKARLAEAENCF